MFLTRSRDENFVQRRGLFGNDASAEGHHVGDQFLAGTVAERSPFAARTRETQSPKNFRRRGLRFIKAQYQPAVRGLDVVQLAAQNNFALMNHGELVGHALDFVQQM